MTGPPITVPLSGWLLVLVLAYPLIERAAFALWRWWQARP